MWRVRTASFLSLCLCLLAACGGFPAPGYPTPTPLATPGLQIDYDQQSSTVILYVDIHYPGLPRPTSPSNPCYRPFLPALRIWGDGYVFLDEHIMNRRSAVMSGKIERQMLLQVLNVMDSQNFFTNWEHMGPNPAGTSLKIGVTLKNRPTVTFETGDLAPALVGEIKRTIKPSLTPLLLQITTDPRVENILHENEGCNQFGSR